MSKETQTPETVEAEDQVQEAPIAEEVHITLSDLAVARNVMDVAIQRGAFRGNELTTVGALYSKLDAFLNAANAQVAEQKAEDGVETEESKGE